jgi:hypothetical protein
MMTEAHATSRQIFGDGHESTQRRADTLAQARRGNVNSRAYGRLAGLPSEFLARYREILNGDMAQVLGYDQSHQLFCVHYCNGLDAVKIPVDNLVLYPGTAVLVEGLATAPEWNGKRGLIKQFDGTRGRYLVVVPGRKKPLGLKPKCCRLEIQIAEVYAGKFQEEIPDGIDQVTRAAMWSVEEKRMQVAERVRAAIAARDAQEPEPEPEPELELEPQPEPEPEGE